jgi:hypothetical protein
VFINDDRVSKVSEASGNASASGSGGQPKKVEVQFIFGKEANSTDTDTGTGTDTASGKLKKQPAGPSSAEDTARQIDFSNFQTAEKGSHCLYLVEAAVFDVLASEPAMDRPALESHGEFPQLPGVEFRLAVYLRNKRSQELAFIRREFDRTQERSFDGSADHFFNLRNQVMPETIANHLPAQVCGIFAELETEGRGKFVDFVFPDLEQGTANQEISCPNRDLRFRLDGCIIQGTSTPEQVEEKGLYLVICVVSNEERGSREVLRGSGKKLESRFACRSFKRAGRGQLGQGFDVQWETEPTSEPADEFAVFQALGCAQIMIQMAYHQVPKTDHWQNMK